MYSRYFHCQGFYCHTRGKFSLAAPIPTYLFSAVSCPLSFPPGNQTLLEKVIFLRENSPLFGSNCTWNLLHRKRYLFLTLNLLKRIEHKILHKLRGEKLTIFTGCEGNVSKYLVVD